jgi:hypothetical protein
MDQSVNLSLREALLSSCTSVFRLDLLRHIASTITLSTCAKLCRQNNGGQSYFHGRPANFGQPSFSMAIDLPSTNHQEILEVLKFKPYLSIAPWVWLIQGQQRPIYLFTWQKVFIEMKWKNCRPPLRPWTRDNIVPLKPIIGWGFCSMEKNIAPSRSTICTNLGLRLINLL